jgi:fimbrial isopeptide formation D2 family protein/LPXTG-motif cell wall-anchored protein
MKKMKSKIGMLLTIVMLLSIAVPVFAAPQTGDLTINGTTAGKVYDLYKVFDLTHSGDNYSYTVTDEFANFFADEKYGDNPVAYVENLKGNADGLANLAKDLLAWAIANNKPTKTVTGTADTTIVNDLDYGYYLMNPNGGSNPTGNYGTMFSLGTVSGEDKEIQLKAEYPTIDKVIVEGEEEVDTNEASIGDDVNYKITTKVPDTTGYKKYVFNVHDRLSKGLTFNNDVEIMIGEEVLNKDSDYNLTLGTGANGETTFKIEFLNVIDWIYDVGEEIVITYTAELNENAEIGMEPNTNNVKLEYSTDPKQDEGGTPEETPEEETKTYTTGLEIYKKDSDGNVLTGAGFGIKRAGEDDYLYNATVDENGHWKYDGLGAGDYVLVETTVPDGYNKMDDVEFTITFDKNAAEGEKFSIDPEDFATKLNDYFTATIVNESGATLPGTGGIGTTIFYTLGTILVLGAGILLIAKRRMASQK